MAMWPFKRRRRGATDQSEKARSTEPTVIGTTSTTTGTSKPSTPLGGAASAPSNREMKQIRRTSHQQQPPAKPWVDLEKRPNSANKENVLPGSAPGYTSREDITALPTQQRLDRSPHLRPVDQERARIPYNFRQHSTSQTSLQQEEALGSLHRPTTLHSERTNTLRSKRSTTDYNGPMRKSSSRRSKRRDDRVREEEIRQLASSPIPIPKRPGDGPLRKDSKKFRGSNLKDSNVSLPAEGSIHSTMSGQREQRGWEVGSFDIFNPRPAVRLSGTPQFHVSRASAANGSGVLYTIESRNGKDKVPESRSSNRHERTVGDEADDLGSGDIRAIMERETKRKQKRDLERQEKLDRKLRNRVARDRADSEKKRRDATSDRRLEEARLRAAEEIHARREPAPPTAIHPALRGDTVMTDADAVGLGIGQRAYPQPSPGEDESTDDPFTDAQEHLDTDSPAMPGTPTISGAQEPASPQFEDAVVRTATAVRLSQAYTPPISPVYASRTAAPMSSSELTDAARQASTSYQSTSHYSMQSGSDLAKPPAITDEPRRSSDSPKDRRTGSTWASIFRRGSTFRKTSRNEGKTPPSEFSFSNTSRESMRNQPIPAHLIDTQASRPPTQPRTLSGTPVRAMSRFHEDLPGMISPPDSRTQSPDVSIAAAVAASQRRAGGRTTPQPGDVRTDTPTSQQNRGPKVSTSLASIDSEGSWLASGSIKRASHQSALSRSLGSKRNRDVNSSFEELGGGDSTAGAQDHDAEYFARNSRRKNSNPTLIGAAPDEESEDEQIAATAAAADPALTVHSSVRRRPTLVQRDDRLKSREGLVTEYLSSTPGADVSNTAHHSTSGVLDSTENDSYDVSPLTDDGDEHFESDGETSPIVELERARSVQYVSRHSRQFSAGSARLLDVKASDAALNRERTPTPTSMFGPASR